MEQIKTYIDSFTAKISKFKSYNFYDVAVENHALFDSYDIDENRILFLTNIECILPSKTTKIQSDEIVNAVKNQDDQIGFWDEKFKQVLEKISSNAKITLTLHYSGQYSDEYIANLLNIPISDFEKSLRNAIREFIKHIPADIIEYLNSCVSRDKIYFLEDLLIQNDMLRNIFKTALSDRKSPLKFSVDDRLNALILSNNFAYKNFIALTDKIYHTSTSKKQIIEKLSQLFSALIVDKIIEKTIGDLSSFDNVIMNVFNEFEPREIAIIKDRFVVEKTLQEIANEYGLTRERVRQIESGIIRKMIRFIPLYIIHAINDDVKRLHILSVEKIGITDPFLRVSFLKIITNKDFSGHLIYDIELNALISDKKYTFNNMRTEIFSFLESIETTVCQKDEIFSYVKYLYPMSDVKKIVDKLLTSDGVVELEDQKVFVQGLYKSKRDKVEFIYSLYPNGFETNKKIDLLKQELSYYFGDVFEEDSDRALTGFASLSEKILLWEWGKHLHIKYAEDILTNFDFTDLLRYIDHELQNVLAVDLDGYYNKNSMALQLFGIPSKYALHTLVKLKYPDEYSYQDSPRIASLGTDRLELRQILHDVMSEHRTYDIDELTQKLNTPKNRIQQLIEHLDDVIAVDLFTYIKIEHIDIDEVLFKKIVQFINEKVQEFKFIYIGLVIDNFREHLHSIGMFNKETMMLQLLNKYRGDKLFNVSNTRIVSKEYPITRHSLNFHFLIEQLMLDREKISKNEVFNYFVDRGLDPKLVMNYYNYSKFRLIVRIDDELFVKMKTININDEIIQTATHFVEKHIQGEYHLSDLVESMNAAIPLDTMMWNRFIVCDILDKNLFRFFPSSDNPIYIEFKRDVENDSEI
ncbi:MAG: sigma factor-like helix-turn-helix DNA-binding protein [Sulfuricurvum sp.]|uniref:sigma factor-like helix-turn-helix DNA-binding protein n=1 Tax=Sulfuricurvum sp. TaxID=2025608 RepID=UPI00260CD121|nr:sigma factor-like helix-turn-helix DNA-binding protein [Sulfuricurvum sp.]MDD5161109.1 sigma factor-like helix-turn-helix DNA-binding protein [Sulfuricurvum sp.]